MSPTPDRGQSFTPDSRTRTTLSRSTTSRRATTRSSRPSTSSRLRVTVTSTSTSTRSPAPTLSDVTFQIAVATSSPTNSPSTPTTLLAVPTASTSLGASCSTQNDCSRGMVCSAGRCATMDKSDLFGGTSPNATTHLSTGGAVGIVAAVMVLAILMFGLGFWCMRSRSSATKFLTSQAPPATQRQPEPESESEPKRSISMRQRWPVVARSASGATRSTQDNDQHTLIGSQPNSPFEVAFATEYYVQANRLDEILEKPEEESTQGVTRYPTGASRASTVNKVLPDLPYSLNVNINKSMIFEDSIFCPSVPQTPSSRARTPRYRFEEVVPPVPGQTPRISITQPSVRRSATHTQHTRDSTPIYSYSSYPYSWQTSTSIDAGGSSHQSVQFEGRNNRGHSYALRRLEGRLPSLPPQAHCHSRSCDTATTVPLSPCSFQSYNWYSAILDPPLHTPDLDAANNAKGVNPLVSHPAAVPTPFSSELALIPQQTDSPPPPPPKAPWLASSHSSVSLSSRPTSSRPMSSVYYLPQSVYQMPSPMETPSRMPTFIPTPTSTRPASTSDGESLYSGHPRYASWVPNDDSIIPEDDLPMPRFPRQKSMAASLAMASPGFEPKSSRRTSMAKFQAVSSKLGVPHSRRESRPSPRHSMMHARRASKSTMKSFNSRSWIPDDGCYLATGESEDSFTVFKREHLKSRDGYSKIK